MRWITRVKARKEKKWEGWLQPLIPYKKAKVKLYETDIVVLKITYSEMQ